MGTPAIITFIGSDDFDSSQLFRFYRHFDGDPVTTLNDFATVFEKARALVDSITKGGGLTGSRGRLKAELVKVKPSILAGLYMGETTGPYGMAVSFLSDDNAYSEWSYLVDVNAGTIEIMDDAGNTVDPFTYIERLHDEYQAEHRASLDTSIAALCRDGFAIIAPSA